MSKSKIKIGEHIRITPGFPFNSVHFNTDGDGLPLIRIRDLLKSKIETFYKGEYLKDFLVKEGDILIGMDGDFHIVKWKNKRKALLNQRIMKIAQKEGAKINIEYFYYFLFPFLKDVWEKTTATTVKHLSTYDVSDAEFNFPDLELQSKIAQILGTTDSIIEKTQATIAKYKAIKQGMLHDLFTRGIDINTGKLRPKYEDAPELYKKSKLGWMPKDWIESKFIDFADENISYSFTGGPFGSDLQTKHYTITGVRIIQLQNIGDGYFKNDYKIYTSEEKADDLISCNIYPGDILISKMADPIARACIIPKIEKRFLMASDGIRLAIDKKKFNTRFVMEAINHTRFRTIAELKATGSTRARIGLSELREITVVYPLKNEQDAIGLKLDTIENKIHIEEGYLEKMLQIKAGLMNDLLSGRKLVTVTEELSNKKYPTITTLQS